ncbi:MAG: hypothetical protein KDD44_00260 [Bdellovibrionales bacterium]|nr:hypothetical protein [Bdellovibrionales bacterium]
MSYGTDVKDVKFDEWAIVEIMGHQTYAGRVTEQTIGGTSFIRIDVPESPMSDGTMCPAFTKLFGAGSIYCITPVSEETARARLRQTRAYPMNVWDARQLLSNVDKRELPMHGDGDDMDDDDELGEEVD